MGLISSSLVIKSLTGKTKSKVIMLKIVMMMMIIMTTTMRTAAVAIA